MNNTPEGNICKLSADLGWAAETLHNVDKKLIQMSKEAKKLQQERDEAREALKRITECDMRWSKKIARKVLQEAQETKPHHWEDRALTAERERDEALNVLREINDWINVAVMRPPTPNEAAYAINAWGDKIRPILEVTE